MISLARATRSGGPHHATRRGSVVVLCMANVLFSASGLRAQTPDEHASHHPGAAASAPAPAMSTTAGMPAGGMMAGMGDMMAKMMPSPSASGGCMGAGCGSGAAKTPIYPTLMTLPALTPAKRAEIDALATQQINDGMARLAKGSASLHVATQAGDNVAMENSVGAMRAGLDELGAGIAARRVVAEGAAPKNLALGWFKREMNLSSSVPHQEPRTLLGVTPFHLFTMVLLITFALAMVAMYFFKMRRAAALFGRIEADKAKPPPGSSPPLAGEPGPPPAGKAPPGEGTPPASPGKAPPPDAKALAPSAPGAPPAGKTSLAAATSPTTPPAAADTAKIASRAGELWQERGRPVGSPEVDWSRAKEELAKAIGKPAVPPIDGTSAAPASGKTSQPGATPPASASAQPSPPAPSAEKSATTPGARP